MRFTKMHGLGNDYVYINCFDEKVSNPEKLAKAISDRHVGVGADGLILIGASDVADCRMDMYNADGSRGEMCGNGIRCVGKFVYDRCIIREKELTVETLAGIKKLKLKVDSATGLVVSVTVNMGEPILNPADIPVLYQGERVVRVPIYAGASEYFITCVSMGNPHAVVFVDDTRMVNLSEVGPFFEGHEKFPNRVNTEFVTVRNRSLLCMRVWERGSGETMACGTGACAALVAAVLNGVSEREADVELDGGILHVFWDTEDNCVYMTGTAETVFSGDYYYA